MKRYINICLVVVTCMMSCTKKLDQVNPNSLTEGNFWKNESDFMAGLASDYKVFRDVNNGYWGVRGIEITNGRGDDFGIRNDVKDIYQPSTFTNNATTGASSNLYTGCYTAIFRANQLMEKAAASTLSAELKKQFTAEAKFIRGVNYFHLAINFGSVPLVTKVPTERTEYFQGKVPEEQIWAQVVKDLQEAKADLPATYPSSGIGRATSGSATGYLGKAFLYTKKYPEAEAEFKLLSQPSGMAQAPYQYDLLPNYGDNFIKEKDNNMESVFEIQIQNVGGTRPWDGENANESLGVTTAQEFAPTEVAGWFEVTPTDKMFNEFKKEKTVDNDFDPRMYASIVWDYPGATFYNKPFKDFKLVFGYSSLIKKYQNYMNTNEGIYISEINEKALRYADVLLMYAEALTMQGKVVDAYPLINKVRQRAKLAPLTAGLDQGKVFEEIRHQRMVEFFREGLRFYDLKRWGLLEQEIKNSDKVGKDNFIASKFTYYPIPQGELNTNPNIAP